MLTKNVIYMPTDNNSKSSNGQEENSPKEPVAPIPKPPYIPSPIRMTIIENGLTMDNAETKTIDSQEE